MPVALIVLVRMGVVSVEKLREFRGYFVVGAAVAAAVVTPPDVVSMLALLLPMWLLYELGIIIATFVSKAAPRDARLQPAVGDREEGMREAMLNV